MAEYRASLLIDFDLKQLPNMKGKSINLNPAAAPGSAGLGALGSSADLCCKKSKFWNQKLLKKDLCCFFICVESMKELFCGSEFLQNWGVCVYPSFAFLC